MATSVSLYSNSNFLQTRFCLLLFSRKTAPLRSYLINSTFAEFFRVTKCNTKYDNFLVFVFLSSCALVVELDPFVSVDSFVIDSSRKKRR